MPTTDIHEYFNTLPVNVRRVLHEYKKPIHHNIFYINKRILRHNGLYIEFNNESWEQKPYVFAKDYYGDRYQYVYPVVLTINNIGSIFDFKSDKLSRRIIVTPLLKDIFNTLSQRIR